MESLNIKCGALWIYIIGFLFCPTYAQTAPPDPPASPPTLSAFAMKMKGVCPKPDIVEDYISSCNGSAISVLPDSDPLSFIPKTSVSSILKVRKQNDMIMSELISRALYNNKIHHHHPKFGFDLISTSFALYGKLCPLIPPSFLQAIYHLYSFISWKTAHNRKEYMSKRHQKWILKLLNNCTLSAKPAEIMTDSCKETAMSYENCTSFICTDPQHEFRLMRTDPILDVVFKAMEMMQAVCFPHFTESYHMFHFYHLAVMDTVTEEMKTRWVNQLDDSNYWRRLLGPSFDSHLINMERCNQGTISHVKFHYRIRRDSLPARIRLAGRLVKL